MIFLKFNIVIYTNLIIILFRTGLYKYSRSLSIKIQVKNITITNIIISNVKMSG